jgi:hypothetical protein
MGMNDDGTPETKRAQIRTIILDLLREHEESEDGLPTQGRILFYELEQRSLAKKPDPDDLRRHRRRSRGFPPGEQDIIDELKRMRDDGIIPWEWIIDLERTVAVWEYFPTVEAFLNAQLDQFRLNPWEPDLPPLILTEAKGVAAVLERIAYEYCCPISGLKGHAGGHLQLQIAPLLADNASARSFISATSTKVETTSRTILTRCSCKRPDGRSSGCGSDLPKNRSTRKKLNRSGKLTGARSTSSHVKPMSAKRSDKPASLIWSGRRSKHACAVDAVAGHSEAFRNASGV